MKRGCGVEFLHRCLGRVIYLVSTIVGGIDLLFTIKHGIVCAKHKAVEGYGLIQRHNGTLVYTRKQERKTKGRLASRT